MAKCSKDCRLDMQKTLSARSHYIPISEVMRSGPTCISRSFWELWSVRQTFHWFRDHDIEFCWPTRSEERSWSGRRRRRCLIRDILGNPFYGAGAYVWARRPVTTLLVDGQLEKRQGAMRPAEECRVFIRNHHVGYIDWATYEEMNSRRIMQRNSVNREETIVDGGVIRAGQGLLVGLIRCGHRCGTQAPCTVLGWQAYKRAISLQGATTMMADSIVSVLVAAHGRPHGGTRVVEGNRAFGHRSQSASCGRTERQRHRLNVHALSRKLEQLGEYEARKAFEQYRRR